MDFLIYLLFRFFVFWFHLIPFRLLYFCSDVLFYWFYYIHRYRKEIVFTNLRNAFPGKPEQEIAAIAKGFYHYMVDVLLESLKSFTMTEQAMVKRYRCNQPEYLKKFHHEKRNVICVTGHYNNWEWGGVATGSQIFHKPVGFYKPLSNRFIDRYINRTRVRGRAILAPITHTAEFFAREWQEPCIFYMVADQSPYSARLANWITFLNQDTAVLHGPEKYAHLHDLPVIFMRVDRIRRGYYKVSFILLSENPRSTLPREITERFMLELEKEIIENPSCYLWSHRRWKLKR
ncbi:MAG: lysophospholipid acyltransferase family protein [bacterium]